MMYLVYLLYAMIGINVIQVAVFVILSFLHRMERKDLYNRMMCGSIQEYEKIGKPPDKAKSAHSRVLEKWRDKGGE